MAMPSGFLTPSIFQQRRDEAGNLRSAVIGRMKQVDGFSLSWMGQNFETGAKETV
jgi:hypothetical protein